MSHEVKRIRAIGDTYIYVSKRSAPDMYVAYLCVEHNKIRDKLYQRDSGSITAYGNSVKQCVASLMFKSIFHK